MAKWTGYQPEEKPIKAAELYTESMTQAAAKPEEKYEPAIISPEPVYKQPEEMSSLSMETLRDNLAGCLSIIDDEVMKGYITYLSQMPIYKSDMEGLDKVQFFRVTELVFDKHEFSVHKLATVFHSLSNKPCTLSMMMCSDGDETQLYLGVRSRDPRYSTATMRALLEGSLLGQFPGTRTEKFSEEKLDRCITEMNCASISSVTCVADYKQDKNNVSNEDFIQGLEKFINSMRGKKYSAIFIADNVMPNELMELKQEYENIYTQISPFAEVQYAINQNTGSSISSSMSESQNISESYSSNTNTTLNKSHSSGTSENHSTNTGITETDGTSDSVSNGVTTTKGNSDSKAIGTSDSHTTGKSTSTSVGINAGINFGAANAGVNASVSTSRFSSDTHTNSVTDTHTESFSESVSKTLTHGVNHSRSTSKSEGTAIGTNSSDTTGISVQNGTGSSYGTSFGYVTGETLSETFGETKGVTLNAKNKTLLSIMDKLEKHLERIEECSSIGMWNCAAYFLAESTAVSETAANAYQSLMSGADSNVERTAVNTWSKPQDTNLISGYIKNFVHPRFVYNGIRTVSLVNPGTLVSTNELALNFGLPRKSVKGLPVVSYASFAQEIICPESVDNKQILLGQVYHNGMPQNSEVNLNSNSLTMHTFVTGSTGSGKSNTVYNILDKLNRQNIPFLVIEPAKGEYKNIFGKTAIVLGTNPAIGNVLRINPFSFPKNVHVLEHIDRLIEIFNVCWSMYAAMPAVLKDSVERAYIAAGWDIEKSVPKVEGLYPSFDDVLESLNAVINNSAYSSDTKGDYVGSLSTRLGSLTNGLNRIIFSGNEISDEELFDKSVIVDISRVGSSETKALIMGIMVLKLQEYRMSQANNMNCELRHITVLEEAHNILKKTSTAQNMESSNLTGKSVEMLTNAIAEMRTYGEGFVIVDQAPDLLDTAVIRNTNTKIVMRLPDGCDREITGRAMSLNEEQIHELSKLKTGVAAIYQNNWQESVLCLVSKYTPADKTNSVQEAAFTAEHIRMEQESLLHYLLKPSVTLEEAEIVRGMIIRSNVSANIRLRLIEQIFIRKSRYEWAVSDYIKRVYDTSQLYRNTQNGRCKTLDELTEVMLSNIKPQFSGFDENELLIILKYIVMAEYEKHSQKALADLYHYLTKAR